MERNHAVLTPVLCDLLAIFSVLSVAYFKMEKGRPETFARDGGMAALPAGDFYMYDCTDVCIMYA